MPDTIDKKKRVLLKTIVHSINSMVEEGKDVYVTPDNENFGTLISKVRYSKGKLQAQPIFENRWFEFSYYWFANERILHKIEY